MSQGTNTGAEGQAPTTGTQGQGQESTQGQGGQGQESGTQQGTQGQQSPQEFDLSTVQDPTVRAYLEKVQKDAQEARQEAARYRTERNQFQTQAQTLQQQNETDTERQQREATERQERLEALERENRTLKVGAAIQKAATDAKAFNPALIASMLDARVTLDDQGNPSNLQDLLKELRQSDPYLFKRVDQGGGEGAGQEGQPTGNMNDVIRGQIAARRGRG